MSHKDCPDLDKLTTAEIESLASPTRSEKPQQAEGLPGLRSHLEQCTTCQHHLQALKQLQDQLKRSNQALRPTATWLIQLQQEVKRTSVSSNPAPVPREAELRGQRSARTLPRSRRWTAVLLVSSTAACLLITTVLWKANPGPAPLQEALNPAQTQEEPSPHYATTIRSDSQWVATFESTDPDIDIFVLAPVSNSPDRLDDHENLFRRNP